MNTKPLIAVVEARLRWYPLIAIPGKEFAAEQALCAAGCLAFCPIEIRTRRTSPHTKQKDMTQHPQIPPYIFVASFGGFPWAIVEQIKEVRYAMGDESEEGFLNPIPISSEEMRRVMEGGYNHLHLPEKARRISTRKKRKQDRIQRRLEAA